MKKSKRNRCKGRTAITFNNKLAKLKNQYNHLFKTSKASQVVYLNVPEADRKPKDKIFFCDKYKNFDKFLSVNKLRQIGNETSKPRPSFNKKDVKKKVTIWGR